VEGVVVSLEGEDIRMTRATAGRSSCGIISSTDVLGVTFSNRVSAAFLVCADNESNGRLVGCFLVGAGVGVSSASDSSASDGVKCVSRLTCFLGGSVSTRKLENILLFGHTFQGLRFHDSTSLILNL
jgi:hypothetical protein